MYTHTHVYTCRLSLLSRYFVHVVASANKYNAGFYTGFFVPLSVSIASRGRRRRAVRAGARAAARSIGGCACVRGWTDSRVDGCAAASADRRARTARAARRRVHVYLYALQ